MFFAIGSIAVLVMLMAVMLGLAWNTERGTAVLLGTAESLVPGLTIDGVGGTLASQVSAGRVVYRNEAIVVTVTAPRFEPELDRLASRYIGIRDLTTQAVHVQFLGGSESGSEGGQVELPFVLELWAPSLGQVTYQHRDAAPVEAAITSVHLKLGEQLEVFDFRLARIEAQVAGNARLRLGPPWNYTSEFTVEEVSLLPGTSVSGSLEGDVAGLSVNLSSQGAQALTLEAKLGLTGSLSAEARLEGELELPSEITLRGVNANLAGAPDAYSFDLRASVISSLMAPVSVMVAGKGSMLDIEASTIQLRSEEHALDGQASYRGERQALDARLSGNWFGQALALAVDMTGIQSANLSGKAHIDVAGNRLSAAGNGKMIDFDLDVARAQAFLPALTGSISGRGTFNVEARQLRANIRSDQLGYEGRVVSGVDLQLTASPQQLVNGNLKIDSVQFDGREIGGGTVTATADDAGGGDLSLEWRADTFALNATSTLQRAPDGVAGNVTNASIEVSGQTGATRLDLASPVSWSASSGNVNVADHCWRIDPGTVCLKDVRSDGPALNASVTANDFQHGENSLNSLSATITRETSGVLDIRGQGDGLIIAGGQLASPAFSFVVSGPPSRLSYQLQAGVQSTINGDIDLRGTITPAQAEIDELTFTQPNGRIVANASFQRETARLTTDFSGNWYGRPVQGQGEGDLSVMAKPTGQLRLSIADNNLSMVAAAGRVTGSLNAAALRLLDPRLAGSVVATGEYEPGAGLLVEGRVASLAIGNYALDRGQFNIRREADGRIDASVILEEGWIGNFPLGDATLSMRGQLDAAEATLSITQPQLGVDMRARFGFVSGRLTGQLLEGQLVSGDQAWALDDTTGFAFSAADGFQLDDHCWAGGDGQLCVTEANAGQGVTSLVARLSGLRIAVPALAIAPDIGVDVALNGELRVRIDSAARNASLNVGISAGQLSYFDDERIPVGGNIALTLEGASLNGTLSLSGADDELSARMSIPDVDEPRKVRASGTLLIKNLGLVTAFVPALDRATGSLSGEFDVDTVSAQRRLDLDVSVGDDASVVIPVAGITLRDLRLVARSDTEVLKLRASASSGDGELVTEGTVFSPLTPSRSLEATLKGEAFTLIQRSDMKVVTTPDMTFAYQPNGLIRVGGSLTVVEGSYRGRTVSSTARQPSSDVFVVGRQQAPDPLSRLDLRLNVDVQQFFFEMYGLKSEVTGDVTLIQAPGTPRRAVGNVNLVEGSFSRYGQNFDVERGRLVFGGPLNNPVVDVVSTRTIQESGRTITVSLVLTGPANNIRSSVVSTPSMSEASALSYLVLGRSLDSATTAEGHMLSGAAVALGLKQAAPITEEIRNALGLSQFTLASDGVDSATVIAGKRLSPELYVEYNYDVFSRVGGILFNYQLTPQLSVETRSGEAKSMELIYTFK